MSPFAITPQQKTFFDTFGYLHMPGLFKDDIADITRAFEEVWTRRGHVHKGDVRSAILPFVDQHERLRELFDDPRILAIGNGILGEDFNFMGSDGNFYVGDTRWHCDSYHEDYIFMKVAFYLDPIDAKSGALRIVPGSNATSPYRAKLGDRIVASEQEMGIKGIDVPAVSLDSQPGDVVAFHHNCLHASYGGSKARRMFTIDMCQHYQDADLDELRQYLSIFGRKGLPHMYGDETIATASPERMRHLKQVLDNDSHMGDIARGANARA
jgi:ectoine hydroxylase-related dioxygenase (phytanoyl-CoA dioxygenase family)